MSEIQSKCFTLINRRSGKIVCSTALSIISAFILAIALYTASSKLAKSANAQIPLQSQFKNVDTNLRAKIAQKLFIDLRYYCVPKAQAYCNEPLLSLPPELASMLTKSKVGGVILFSENLSSAKQIVRLTHQLQTALMPIPVKNTAQIPETPVQLSAEHSYVPLYIGIDQEGGRVSRLPQHEFLGFAGNMAIGASATTYKNHFAQATSKATAQHLSMLGINVNFAPVLDVNSNPDNPIINVRSYAQFPKVVASLGGASIQTMQEHGISVAAKHFPGHGDTLTDSHVGLPIVKHQRDLINKVDLYPFRSVIANDKTQPDMIMTAHIQYPALDNTPLIGDRRGTGKVFNVNESQQLDATSPVLPATLSQKILTGILRDEYAYSGLIITDALDMRAITQYLTPTQALIKSFSAGADITLMPYQISSPEDAIGFLDWLNTLTILISQDSDLKAQINASYDRIIAHKNKRKIAKRAMQTLSDKLVAITNKTHMKDDMTLATSLSQASFTQIKGLKKAILPTQNLLVLMPDKRRCQAFEYYWMSQIVVADTLQCVSVLSEQIIFDRTQLENVDVIVIGDVSPQLAFYESAKFEGIEPAQRLNNATQLTNIDALLVQAKQMGITAILAKLRSPYISEEDITKYDAIYATYDYQVADKENLSTLNNVIALFSPAFASLVNVITGKQQAQGHLPVSLAPNVVTRLPDPKVVTLPADNNVASELPKPN